jgi:hypothetical protein
MKHGTLDPEFQGLTEDEQRGVIGGAGFLVKWWDVVAGLIGVTLPTPNISPIAL